MCEISINIWSKQVPKMVRTWCQNPQKSPPEGDLKTEPPKMVKNDPKLLPKGSQMETPGRSNFGNRGVRRTLSSRTRSHYRTHVLNWRLHRPQRHLLAWFWDRFWSLFGFRMGKATSKQSQKIMIFFKTEPRGVPNKHPWAGQFWKWGVRNTLSNRTCPDYGSHVLT